MRLAFAPGIALAFLAWACASQERVDTSAAAGDAHPAQDASEPQPAPRDADLSRERQLVEESRAAAKAVDLEAARAKAGEAIELLLARPESEHDAGWLELLNAAGVAAWKAQDARAAQAAFEKVVEVRSRALPEEDPDLQAARSNLAATMSTLGDNQGARAILEKVLEVFTRTLPDDHPHLQAARQNLANTLRKLGDLPGARALLEKALEVRSRTLPDDHPDLQMARGNLAITIVGLGDLPRARALFEKVLEVRSRTLPDDHPDLQGARGNLAGTIKALGDLQGARALEEKVLEVGSRTLPDDHPDLQMARGNLAITIRELGDFTGARALEEKVLEVFSRTLPDDHPDLQMARGNLAVTMQALGDLQGARALEEKVLEVRSRTLPDDHPDLQLARGNLAGTIRALGDLAGARALFEKVLEVRSRTLPEEHADLQLARRNLIGTIAAERAAGRGEEEGGSAEFTRLADSFTRAVAKSARLAVLTASGREAEERCANALSDLGSALSFAEGLGVFGNDVRLEREAFVLSEETRGAALASAHLSRRAIADARYGTLREEMRSSSAELARLAENGATADELDRSRARRESAERELANLARKLSGNGTGLLEFDTSALSAALSEREALVGYRRYRRTTHVPGEAFDGKATESLCAFVLRSGDRLERIEFGPIQPIEKAVERWRAAIGVRLERGVGVTPDVETESRRSGDELRRLVFDPFADALEGVERLVVALDDVLHLVPLDALPLDPATGTPMGSRWRIETRSTLSELTWREGPVPRREALLALGGASFNLAPLPPSAEETAALDDEHAGSVQAASPLRGAAWERGFEPLTNSGPEARGIAALYGEAFDEKRPAVVLEKRKASRASLAELAPKARFLHLATHGWYVPESVRSMAEPKVLDAQMGFGARMSGEERASGMSPMLLCGLALAGANLEQDELGRAPGLVTAEELSALDLSGCELAVLSACDTNVGERRAGQGVASLQKALHMAGARTVITSLWKVPDEATRELMLDFYRRIWIEKKPKGVALWEAKQKIRNARDERGKPLYSTRDWAAWVLTGDPR